LGGGLEPPGPASAPAATPRRFVLGVATLGAGNDGRGVVTAPRPTPPLRELAEGGARRWLRGCEEDPAAATP